MGMGVSSTIAPKLPKEATVERRPGSNTQTQAALADAYARLAEPAPQYQSPGWLSILFTPITWGRL